MFPEHIGHCIIFKELPNFIWWYFNFIYLYAFYTLLKTIINSYTKGEKSFSEIHVMGSVCGCMCVHVETKSACRGHPPCFLK